jgi:hypothetical protein
MTLSQFDNLPLDEKTNYLWDNGICEFQRMLGKNHVVCIFEIHDFFVEACYSRADNCVESVEPIYELPEWEAYMKGVVKNQTMVRTPSNKKRRPGRDST